MTREEELETALRNLVLAVQNAKDDGCIDHLDCLADGGEAFHNAMREAKQLTR